MVVSTSGAILGSEARPCKAVHMRSVSVNQIRKCGRAKPNCSSSGPSGDFWVVAAPAAANATVRSGHALVSPALVAGCVYQQQYAPCARGGLDDLSVGDSVGVRKPACVG